MTMRSTSSDIQAANSALAQFLRSQEEEEMILQIGKRKPKPQGHEKLPAGRGRWSLQPDWRAPTPRVDRPRTIEGATSFHFSYTSVSRVAVPTINGRPIEGFRPPLSSAFDHSKYIEREGAAELAQGMIHASYIERPGALEFRSEKGVITPAFNDALAVIDEGVTASEAEVLGHNVEELGGVPSVFSNISDDPFERQEFWRAVERSESFPKKHWIYLDPWSAPDWWQELEITDKLPADFKTHALGVAESYREHMAKPIAEGEERERFFSEPFEVTADEAGEIFEAARRMAHHDDRDPGFHFQSGSGGRVQFRLVCELPYEVSANDRALITWNFCQHLASLTTRAEPDGRMTKKGFMFTAVIHAPDSHNDNRNYHLHIVGYDRPCRFMPEHGQWDFEVEEHYDHKGENRVRHPYRQNKIEEAARTKKGFDRQTTGKNFIPGLRAKFAEINNAVLKARGIKRQLDARKYTDMGIDRTPTEHLGTKAAALEGIGVPTTVGQLNAIAIWSDAERAIHRQASAARKSYETRQIELEGIARRVLSSDPHHPAMGEFCQLLGERLRLIAEAVEGREALMIFDHMEAKAKSRAVRTRQTCAQFLADIENGKADRPTSMMKLAIQDRWKGAQRHIESIDKALEPHREALANAAEITVASERRIREIDTILQSGKAALESHLAAGGQSVPAERHRAPAATHEAPKDTPKVTPSASEKDAETKAAELVQPEALVATPVTTDKATIIQPEIAVDQAVAVEPASIEGLPIVEPTIPPRQDVQVEEVEAEAGTPEGLEPLRPVEVVEPSIPGEQIIVPDLNDPAKQEEPAPPPVEPRVGSGPVTEPTPEVPAPSVKSGPQTSEPDKPGQAVKARPQPALAEPAPDGRSKPVDPALSDLPKGEPSQPGMGKSAYANFDALCLRIMKERIPIVSELQPNGTTKFAVPSLNPDEQKPLSQPRFARRANQRLKAIHEKQQNEIRRAIRWVQSSSSSGQNPELLRIENRSASLGENVKDSVKTLFKNWGRHPDVVAALRAENDRRVELARHQAKQVQAAAAAANQERQVRRAEAAELYPTPDQAFTQEVEDFIRLLRDAAPDEQLQEAADKIHDSPRAREDINKHNVHLATAYHQYCEGVDQLEAQRARQQHRFGR